MKNRGKKLHIMCSLKKKRIIPYEFEDFNMRFAEQKKILSQLHALT